MNDAFNEPEFKLLAFTFNLNYDNLPGDTLQEKILAFVDYHYRTNRLRMLVDFLDGTRPDRKWKTEDYDLIDS